ncbi:major tail protein [Streptococcus gallolyticus]|uniref:major tail protein n=1 Tax=Streptococcus gallolyticus TaxID=315405 RepID=UPI000E427F41|nr:major tail protein [Streptococcus gallolyticus]RGC38214.1 phage tail protein [Streptococcus gallolyticus]
MTLVGFERMEIRILDGAVPEVGKNLFIIEGKKGEGATQTANITGLSSEPVKTYGSNSAYYTSRKGVGDVKAEVTAVDVPFAVQNAILGRKKKNGLTVGGADTEPPLCSVAFFSEDPYGKDFGIGFYCGVWAMDGIELNTKKGEKEELASDSLTFSAEASDAETSKGDYYVMASGDEEIGLLEKEMQFVEKAV